nr:retrovirus-related Pol polyprotein from transposon TNT 1-94 [Tanacetum cinerariifolium]
MFVTLVKQSQELKSVSYYKLCDILKINQNKVNKIRVERLACTANPPALVAQQQLIYHLKSHPTYFTQNSSNRTQHATTRNRAKAIVNSHLPVYDQEPDMVAEDDALSKEKEIDKLMALISLSFKKIYKPTNNNLRPSPNTSRANQDNTLRINRETGYDNQRAVIVAGAMENVDAVDISEPIFDTEPLKKIQSDNDEYNVFANDREHLEQPEFVNDTYPDKQGNDLLTGSRGTYLYFITIQHTTSPNPICLLAKASLSQAWLWHRRIPYMNFDTINLLSKYDTVTSLPKLKFVKDHLCSSCKLRKAKRKSFKTKTTPSSKRQLQILHMDLCGPMRVESINGKKYVLVIVDDYSRYTWTHFLRSKDETPKVFIDFLKLVQKGLHAQVRTVQINKGTKFLNKTLHAYFAQEGIEHQTSIARTPKQNNIVKRQNCTLVKATRTMLSAAKSPLFFWAEAIATTCFTQNRSLVIPQHEKTPYHIINGLKPSVKFFYIFRSLCYIVRDGENLDKMKEKGDACIFIGYSTQSRAYRVYNKRTRLIVETIHVNFDELPLLASDYTSSNPVPQCPTTTLEQDSLSLVVSKYFAVHAVDTPNQRQKQNTTPSTSITAPIVTDTENINQAEAQKENVMIDKDEFINIFSTPIHEQGETSSRYVDSSNMHTFYQRHPSEHRWTRDHPLEQVIGNPSQSVRIRHQLEIDGEMCMFALTVIRTISTNIKEAMADSVWIEAMQEELHQFD